MTVDIPISIAEGATLPQYESQGAAGLDLRILVDCELAPMARDVVGTGLRVAIPLGYEGQVRPRSGLAARHGLSMVNSPGTIDADYRGEIKMILINMSSETVKLEAGTRVGQLVICPIARGNLIVVEDLSTTLRGEGGFGSTG